MLPPFLRRSPKKISNPLRHAKDFCMTYSQWYQEHALKHAKIVEKLAHLSDDEVIAYFDYENMKSTHPDFCPLYGMNQKCHDIDKLNCYLCGCPYFRYDDNGVQKVHGKTVYSYCSINAKERGVFESGDSIHCNCSECTLPHRAGMIKKCFSRKWEQIICSCGDQDGVFPASINSSTTIKTEETKAKSPA